MHLLALADTVSTCNTDLAERFAIDAAASAMAKENLVGQSDDVITDSLDDCGLRFLLAMKHYSYLLRYLNFSTSFFTSLFTSKDYITSISGNKKTYLLFGNIPTVNLNKYIFT